MDAPNRATLSKVASSPAPRPRFFDILLGNHRGIGLWIVAAAFAGWTLYLTFAHVPWRDEGQAWLFARDQSIPQMFLESRHEGHPILWHLCLQTLQAAGLDSNAMFVLHWALLIFGAGLLLFRSPLPLLARVGFLLAPVCLLEIPSNARNYAITIPLIFGAALRYKEVERKPYAYSLLLMLLPHANVYAAAVFMGIWLQFLLDQCTAFGRAPFSIRPALSKYAGPNTLLLLSALLLAAQLVPMPLAHDVPGAMPLRIEPGEIGVLMLALLVPTGALYGLKPGSHPRLYGPLLILLLVLVPSSVYLCSPRHKLAILLGIIYFCWIYYDELVADGRFFHWQLGQRGMKACLCTLILSAAVLVYPWNAWSTWKKNLKIHDSRRTVEAIVAANLDRPDIELLATEPGKMASLLFKLRHIRDCHGLPPFDTMPTSFVCFQHLRAVKKVPTLSDLEPLAIHYARANPAKTILLISDNTTVNRHYQPASPDYTIVPVYGSPVQPNDDELFQVYLFKPRAASGH